MLQLQDTMKQKRSLQILSDQKVFDKVDIVAMTTTGCAKNYDLLRNANFPIVIVEEAAEVFEGHIISCFSKKTEHLVLIGDH